jgi:hypothetical protein
MRMNLLRAGGAAAVATAALLALTVPANAATAGPGEGSAFGAVADVSLLPGVLGGNGISVQSGHLAPSATAGPAAAEVLDAGLRGLVTARTISSSATHGATGEVDSTAKLVDVTLPVLAAALGGSPSASVISATCRSTTAGIVGDSDLADLDLGRLGHVTAATPNLQLGVPGVLSVVANEQIHNADGSLTVNALDIKLLGGSGLTGALGRGSIVLASATCGPATTTQAATPTPTTATPVPEVAVIPVGGPQTGDGSLATVVVH